MLLALSLLLIGSAICLLAMAIVPILDKRRMDWEEKKEHLIGRQMDDMFYYDKTPKEIIRLYYILPPVFALSVWFLFSSPIFVITGAVLGFAIPTLILKFRDAKRRKKFNIQILDTVMLLSSSLKGGLSLLQGLEVILEEMPAPMSQEIGLSVRENKMGVTLEQSLRNLGRRMKLDDLDLVINSLLIARETGGDLIKVLSRLSTTIRDNRKLKEIIKTLTMQGRMQGIIMSLLPILFVWWVMFFNRHHFDYMLQDNTGRLLLLVAVILQLVGMILIKKFSTIKV